MATDYAEQALAIAKDAGRALDDSVAQINALCAAAVLVGGPVTNDGDTPGLENFLWPFWTGVVDAMQNDTALHARGAALLSGLKALPDPGGWRVWDEEAAWAGLPLFGPVVRESYNGPVPGSDSATQEWLSLNAFLARLLGTGVWDSSALYALWAMRDALEYAPASEHYVDEEERDWGLEKDMELFEVSAKDARGIESLFGTLIKAIIARKDVIEQERIKRERDSVILNGLSPTWNSVAEEEEMLQKERAGSASTKGWSSGCC